MTFANKIWIFLQISVSVKWQCCGHRIRTEQKANMLSEPLMLVSLRMSSRARRKLIGRHYSGQ